MGLIKGDNVLEKSKNFLKMTNDAHWVDLKIRRDGEDRQFEADWLKEALKDYIRLVEDERSDFHKDGVNHPMD